MKSDVEGKIIVAAREVFFEKGYSATTIRDIASRADVNLALLHYYFRTKENILKVVFQDAITLLFDSLNKVLKADLSLFDRIEKLIDSYVSIGFQEPQLTSFVMSELSVNSDLLMEFITSHPDKPELNQNFGAFSLQVQEAVDAGILKEVSWLDILMDIQSLALYPFVAKKLLLHSVFQDEASYNAVVRNRVSYIKTMIISNIKV